MKPLRRKTREALRHERAVVVQQVTTPTTADLQREREAEQARGAELRRRKGVR